MRDRARDWGEQGSNHSPRGCASRSLQSTTPNETRTLITCRIQIEENGTTSDGDRSFIRTGQVRYCPTGATEN